MRFQSNDTDKARYNQKYRYEERAAFITHIRPKTHLRKRLPRSSYAFAQQEGWGPLITTGRMQVKRTSDSRNSDLPDVWILYFQILFIQIFFLL